MYNMDSETNISKKSGTVLYFKNSFNIQLTKTTSGFSYLLLYLVYCNATC